MMERGITTTDISARPRETPSDQSLMALFQTKPGFLLARIDQICTAIFSKLSGSSAIFNRVTLSQAELLLLSDRIGPVIQTELARAAGVDTSTTATILNNLQANGLILRQVKKGDRRSCLVSLTPAGRLALPDVSAHFAALQHQLLARISPEQSGRLTDILQAVALNAAVPAPVWRAACDPASGVLDGALSFLTRRVLQLMQAQFLHDSAGFGLTLRQFSLLFLLSQRGSLTQTEFSRLFGLDPATCGVIMRGPARSGLIVMEPCPHDGRARIARLTDHGADILRTVHPLVDGSDQRVFSTVTTADRDFVVECLRAIVQEHASSLRYPGLIG